MGLFKKGYSAVREEQQRQEENREKMGKMLWRFFLSGDGAEAQVRFLTEEPINFQEHTVKSVRGGKEHYDNVICTHDIGECPLCDSGDRPQFKGAYLIYDRRPVKVKDKNGKEKTVNGQLRLYVQGARVLSQLDRLSDRYGLTNRDYIISRAGSGTSTTYMFDRCDEVGKLTKAEITNMLPEKLRDMYDGTMESLYNIVQNQLEMSIQDYDGSTEDGDDQEDDEDDLPFDSRRNLVGVPDDDDGEDDEEDYSPRRSIRSPSSHKSSGKKPSMFKSPHRPQENSVKRFFKK